MTTHVHLVGSLGLASVPEAFASVSDTVGPFVRRCPDGEVGGRRMWIGWQWPLLRASQFLVLAENGWIPNVGVQSLRLREECSERDVWFGELGYAREACASFAEFEAARSTGRLGRDVRFQVCLPTPAAVVGAFVTPTDIPRVLPAYEAAMRREVARICESIPHESLAIQWDVCVEMIQWDGRFEHMPPIPNMAHVFGEMFSRLGRAVPDGVELGVHLCYGDHDNRHFVEPEDLARAVELATLIAASVGRPLNWVHMPVPMERFDDAYFAPLARWQRGAETELYLGLVHWQDGVEGSLRRASAARRAVSAFGIGTECGLGRARSPQKALEILRVQARVAAEDPGIG